MPGFPLAALGAGLGLWAKDRQEQQAQRERQQMLMLTLQRFQQEQQDRQESRAGDKAEWGTLLGGGGTGVGPVNPTPGLGGGVGVPVGGGGSTEVPFQYGPSSRPPGGSAPRVVGTPTPSGGRAAENPWQQPLSPDPADLEKTPSTFTPMRTPPELAGGNTGAASTGEPPPAPYNTGTVPQDTRRVGFPPPTQMADAGGAGETQVAENVPPENMRKVEQSIPTEVRGRMSAEALARQIEQNCPNCSETAKLKALKSKLQLLAPQEQERMRQEFQRNSQIFTEEMANKRAARAETALDKRQAFTEGQASKRAADQNWDLLTDPTTGQQYYVQKGHPETAKDLSGQPYRPGGAARVSGGGTGSASAGREADITKEITRRDAEWDAAHPGASNSDKSKAHFENRKAAEKAMTAAKTSEGRNPAAMHMRKYLEQNPEATPADISRASSTFVRDQSIERNFAGGSGATQMRSLNTVADHLSLMRGYAEALKTGDIPRINQLQQLLSKETGWPEVTNFNVARDIMADEVVRLLTSTGGTEADRAGMQSRFAAAASPDQMHGALEAAERFVAGRFKGLEQNYARNDPSRRREFEQEMLTPEARSMFTKHGQEPASGAPAAGQATSRVPVPPGAAKDPDGTSYQNGQGTWVKKGNELVLTPGAVKTQ